MARTRKPSELSLSGPSLASKFALTMTIALAVVMVAAGAFLYSRVVSAAESVQENTFIEATRLQGPLLRQMKLDMQDEIDKQVYARQPQPRERIENPVRIQGTKVESYDDGAVTRSEVMYGPGNKTHGYMYLYKDVDVPLFVPIN